MQIEIACTGGYKIENFLDELDNLYGCIDNTIEGLSNVCCEITRVNGGMNSTLDEAYTNINCRIVQEKNKQDSVRMIRERAQLFYDTTLQIDEQIACQVDENSEKFFAEYSGMGAVSSIEESWWDKFVDVWNDIWDTVEDAMEAAIDGICDFFTEHAVEVIVGSIGFIVGGALMIYLGGVTLATVAMTALLALGAVALEAGIMALIEYLRGGNFWEAFQEYFASGFMFAGIFFALQAIFSAVANIIKARKAEKARKAAEVAKKVDDVAAGGKSTFNPTPELEKHIKNADPSVPRKRGIGGAHNSTEFFKNDVEILSETPSKIQGVKTVEYKMPKLNADGTPTGEYGARVFRKTIYDPDIISDDEFIRRGLEAANDAISKADNGIMPKEWSGVDNDGIRWHGYYEDGKITSFFPDE